MKQDHTNFSAIGLIIALACAGSLLAACDYLPPSRSLPTDQQSELFKVPPREGDTAATSSAQPTALNSTPEPTQIPNCTDSLEYIADISIPDGTQLNPGTVFEKEWQVKNNGTCNWNNGYTLRLVSGDTIGADTTQAIVPARNGTETVLRIEFIAPEEPGKYTGTWRAYSPDGEAFGQWLTIEIGVTSP
jgi:hypothetical protein